MMDIFNELMERTPREHMREQRCGFRKQVLDCDVEAYNRLRTAIRCRNKDQVEQLVLEGVKVNGIFDFGFTEFDPLIRFPATDGHVDTNYASLTPLHLAVISRDVDIVRILLEKGADTNVRVWNGDTPLTLAAKMHNTTITDLLLSHDSVKDSSDHHGFTHLHIACMRNNTKLVKKLLLMNQGQHINKAVRRSSVHWAGYSPLHFAVQFECVETVQLLLENGADILNKNNKECTPLHLADLHRNEQIIDLILEAHKNEFKNPVNLDGLSHFHIACTRNNTSVVEHFLKIGVDINEVVTSSQWEGWRPIHFAMLHECSNVIELLLKGKVQLESSCFSELLECAYTAENEATYNPFQQDITDNDEIHPDYKKLSSFHYSCIQNEAERIQNLLHSSVISTHHLNEPIWNGWISLHLAVKYRNMSVVQFLLTEGVDITATDTEGRTPLHLAFKNGMLDISSKIIRHVTTSTPNVTDSEGLSIFHILCAHGQIQTIEDFLSNGVDINMQVGIESASWAGFTPMHFAVKFAESEVVDVLLKHQANILLEDGLNLNPLAFTIHLMNTTDYDLREESYFEILMKILSYASEKHICSDYHGLSILHLLTRSEEELEQYKEYVLAHRDEINKISRTSLWPKHTPLHLAGIIYHRFGFAEVLLENGADASNISGYGYSLINGAFLFGMPPGRLIEDAERIFDLVSQNKILEPSHFHLACGAGLFNVVKNVLDAIENSDLKMKYLNFPNDFGQTPLHSLMLLRNNVDSRKKIANLLLENGADIHARDFELQSALHCALTDRNPDIIRILLDHGANANAQNIFGQTPLLKLISDVQEVYTQLRTTFPSFYEQITLLLEGGSDVNIVDRAGKTCFEIVPDVTETEVRIGIACVITKHVKKLALIGYHIIDEKNQEDYNKLSSSRRVQAAVGADFDEKCEHELSSLQREYVDRYTSLYSILFKSPNSMTVHCDNDSLKKIIQSAEFVQKFPLYSFLIKQQVRNGKQRQPLLNESKNHLSRILGRSLPPQCIETILDYLSNTDLKNIIANM